MYAIRPCRPCKSLRSFGSFVHSLAQFAPSALKSLFAGLNCPISFYSKLINSNTRHGYCRAQFTPPAALVARWCGWPCGRRAAGGWRKYQHTTQAARRPAGLALRCRLAGWLVSVAFRALLAVCGAFRALSVCWWYNYTSCARCAQYTPVFVPCVRCLYKHQPRQCWRRPCWPCVAVSRPCVAFAWLAGRARSYPYTAEGLYPCAAGVARYLHLCPVLAVSRRFGGLSALRWCPMLARCPCARFAGVGVLVR